MKQAPEHLVNLIEPIVEGLGYECVGIEYNPHPKHGLLRIYIDSDNGILVENGNADALADGITELLSNPIRMEAMRSRSAQFARETFSKNQVEQKLLDAFRTVYAKHFS